MGFYRRQQSDRFLRAYFEDISAAGVLAAAHRHHDILNLQKTTRSTDFSQMTEP